MTQPSAMLPLGLVAPVLFAVATSLLTACGYPFVRRRLERLAPSLRRKVLLAVALGPVLAGVGLTTLAFSPSLVALIWPAADHCQLHEPPTHPHLCLVHPPRESASAAAWLLVGGVVGAAVLLAVQQMIRLIAASSLIRRLSRFARPDESTGASVFEATAPLALTAGAFEHSIYLSTGLLEAVSAQELAVVLAHERHHATSRDPFWRSLTSLSAGFHLPSTRRRILADLHLASEQACDEAAAIVTGNRPLVARTIIMVSRLLERHGQKPAPALVGFGGHHVVARVEAMLADAPGTRHRRLSPRLVLAALGILAALAGPFHHLAETLLGLLAS